MWVETRYNGIREIKCPKHGYWGYWSEHVSGTNHNCIEDWLCPGCIAEEYIDIVESPCGFVEQEIVMEPETQLDKVMSLIGHNRELSERLLDLLDNRHPKSSRWANSIATTHIGGEILFKLINPEDSKPLPSVAAIAMVFYSLGFIDCQKYGIPDELGQIIMGK